MLIAFKILCLVFITLSQAVGGEHDLEKGDNPGGGVLSNQIERQTSLSSVDIDDPNFGQNTPPNTHVTPYAAFPQTADMPLAALDIYRATLDLEGSSARERNKLCCLSLLLIHVPCAVVLWLLLKA